MGRHCHFPMGPGPGSLTRLCLCQKHAFTQDFTQGYLHSLIQPERKNGFPPLQSSMSNTSSARAGPRELLPNHGGILVGLISCRSCPSSHSCSEFMSAMTMSCLEDTPPHLPVSMVFLLPLPQCSVRLGRREIDRCPSWGCILTSTYSYHSDQL